jgi:hypothetical protein
MTDKHDNPPAFPCETDGNPNGFQSGVGLWTYPGMSLRDWFAGQLISPIYERIKGTTIYSIGNPKERIVVANAQAAAREAYQVADAMLAERERQS